MKYKIIYIITIFCLLLVGSVHADSKAFLAEVKKIGATLVAPQGYKSVAPTANDAIEYGYALQNPEQKYEIRYAIKKNSKTISSESADIEKLFKDEFETLVHKISGSTEPIITGSLDAHEMPKFQGEAARYVLLKNIKSQFGGPYKDCFIIGIARKKEGQLFMFHLADNYEDVKDTVRKNIYSLRFTNTTIGPGSIYQPTNP